MENFDEKIIFGWQCPVCGTVNAPWVSKCPCSKKGAVKFVAIPKCTNCDKYDKYNSNCTAKNRIVASTDCCSCWESRGLFNG